MQIYFLTVVFFLVPLPTVSREVVPIHLDIILLYIIHSHRISSLETDFFFFINNQKTINHVNN